MDERAVMEIVDLIGESSYADYYKIGRHHAYQARKGKFILSIEVLEILKGAWDDVTKRIANDFRDALVFVGHGDYVVIDKYPGVVSTARSVLEGEEEVAYVFLKGHSVNIKTSREKFRHYDVLDVFEAYARMLKPQE